MIIHQKIITKTQATKTGIYVPLVAKLKKQLQHHGKMVVKVLQGPTTISFVVKQEILTIPAEIVTLRYI
jgi:hypothetical protein